MASRLFQRSQVPTKSLAGIGLVAIAAALAAWVQSRSRKADRSNPPEGRVIEVDGVKLHVVERGQGPAVVLIHGNNVWWRDWVASGLVEVLARNHRVLVFDRPGFGHSERPRDRRWTPFAQAHSLAAAMQQLGVSNAAVVGHSMGSLVALALALDHPEVVGKLVLVSGYHFPKFRLDAVMTAPVAWPVLGDAMRYTVTALSARAFLDGAVKQMFAPNDVPANWISVMSREMLVRPVQLRANAEDAGFMMSAASEFSARLQELKMPLTIIAGEEDTVVDPDDHSRRLHESLPGSRLVIVPGAGHMVHYLAHQQIEAAVAANVALIGVTPEEARATATSVVTP